jgi:hypothetical protein
MRPFLLVLILATGCAHQQRQPEPVGHYAEEGGGGFVPGAGRLVTKSLLAQAMAPVGSQSWVGQAHSLTLSNATADTAALTIQDRTRICLNGTTCSKYISLTSGGAVVIATNANALVGSASGNSSLGLTNNRYNSAFLSGALASSASSGANAISVETNGARIDFGAGASDYASSDGTTVTFAGPIASSSSVSATGFSVGSAGNVQFTSPTDLSSVTCTAARAGQIRMDAAASGASERTRLCLCTHDGAGTAAGDYDWVNLKAGTVGTESTCPND